GVGLLPEPGTGCGRQPPQPPGPTTGADEKGRRGTEPKCPPGSDSRRAEIVAGAASASLIAGAAKRRSARRGAVKFFSARRAQGLFLLRAHGHEAIMSAHGDAKETKHS